MKTHEHTQQQGGPLKVSPQERQRLLDGFFASGLSAVAYSRQCGVKYPTLLYWIRQSSRAVATASSSPQFLEAVVEPLSRVGLEVEVGTVARLLVRDDQSAMLAARLLNELRSLSC